MGRMIRAKREFLCSVCDAHYLHWQGFCDTCGRVDTIHEHRILPDGTVKSGESIEQKRLRLRAKRSERSIAKRMTAADGADPEFARIASSTGRIGHITGIRADAVSAHYIIENKNRKLPLWLLNAWILINQRGVDFHKHVLLHIEPPNMPREIQINGVKEKLDTMAVITQTRHEELIAIEKTLQAVEEAILSGRTNIPKIKRIIEDSKSTQKSK